MEIPFKNLELGKPFVFANEQPAWRRVKVTHNTFRSPSGAMWELEDLSLPVVPQ